jgi:hypothetical protein
MVRLKNEMDALDELNEEVEDSAANTQDLAAKTARFAALLNMMIPQSILKRGDTTSALLSQGAERRSIENFFFLPLPFLKGALEIGLKP